MNTILEKRIMNFQLDSFKIVHHARYLELLEEARWLYCYENRLVQEFHTRGIIHVIVNINIDYRSSAVFGDIITINTGISKTTEKSITFRQKVLKNKNLITEADITNVFIKQSDNSPINIQDMNQFWDDIKNI